MESLISELIDKLLFFIVVGTLLGLGAMILKLLFFRSFFGKLLGVGKKRSRKNERVEPEGVLNGAGFFWDRDQEVSERKRDNKEKEKFDLYESFRGSNSPAGDRNYSEVLMDRGGAYIARPFLMTPVERDVYHVLEKAYGDKYRIFCQVRVVDIIKPDESKYHPKSREYMSLFRQLSQWHFDYVLCYRDDFKLYCALELDDASHDRPDRMKRDRIINRLVKLLD